jgi:hypothetical protein
MRIYEWFDPDNIEHIKAYKELQETGTWPKYFYNEIKDKGIELGPGWQLIVAYKLADKWIEYKLDGTVYWETTKEKTK